MFGNISEQMYWFLYRCLTFSKIPHPFCSSPHAVHLTLCKKAKSTHFSHTSMVREIVQEQSFTLLHISAVCSCSHHWTTCAAVSQFCYKPWVKSSPTYTALQTVVCSLCFHSRAAEVERQIFVGEVQALVCCEQHEWIKMLYQSCLLNPD